MSFLVLLKDGLFAIVECSSREIFDVARERDAGICGVFEERELADALVAREQGRIATLS
jgi:hypothetical protein